MLFEVATILPRVGKPMLILLQCVNDSRVEESDIDMTTYPERIDPAENEDASNPGN